MKFYFTLIIILIIHLPIKAQINTDSISIALTKLYNQSQLKGFSAAIINKDAIVYAKGFGYADKDNHIPYTIHTTQPIASISKTLIAVALMKAQEMGKLCLSDKINTYLPFKIYNPNFPEEAITIKQLANHTSSILDGDAYDRSYVFRNKLPPFYTKFNNNQLKGEVKKSIDFFNANTMMSLGEFIKKQYVKNQLWYNPEQNFSKDKPGTSYKYSNMGANIAAYIIEQATGENYAEFVQKHILNPLNMTHSGWKDKNFEPKNLSTLYWYGQAIPHYDLIGYPDGNFTTNIVDYSKFLRLIIKGYHGENNLLSSKSYKEMLKAPASPSFKKGVFWSIDPEKIGHSGSELGLLTHAYFLKENGIGIIVFTNTSDLESNTIEVRDIYRILLKHAKTL